MKKPLAAILVLFAFLSTPFAQDSLRIFWFGHSLMGSGSNYRSTEFAAWSKEGGIPLYQKMHNALCYNYDIKQSWNETCNPNTIRAGGWDYVIWNDLYTYTWTSPRDTFLKYTKLYIDLVHSVGAIPVIYDEWHNPATNYVQEACRSWGAYTAPINNAYVWVSQRYPYIQYTVDGAHSDLPLGYLAGVTTWIAAFGQRPFALGNVYAGLDSGEAHLMRQVAWNAVVDTPAIDYINWPLGVKPRLVKQITFEKKADTLDQLVSRQLSIRTTYSNDSTEGLTHLAIFRSLTPSLANVSHSGLLFSKMPGVAKIEALREKKCDTMTVLIRSSLPAPDSVRIAPHMVPGYAGDNYQFTASGYFRINSAPIVLDVTEAVNWFGVDSVFAIMGGKLQRKSGQAGGGLMFVAVELNGAKDTVRFSMMPELALLKRINFQDRDTVYHQDWQADWARAYNDSVGFGWLDNAQYFVKSADDQGIRYSEKNFLTHSYVKPQNSAHQNIWGTFKIKGPDSWYILKAVMGDHNAAGVPCSLVQRNDLTMAKDTLVAFTGTPANLLTVVLDTIEVHGMNGIQLSVYGPIQYLVICSMQGVNIDSIAFDSDEYICGTVKRNKKLLVDFGASPAQNVFEIPGWNRAIKDAYNIYSNTGPAGIFGASNYCYAFQGVVGTLPYTFFAGDTVEARLYNNCGRTLTFVPRFSFNDSARWCNNGGTWYPVDTVIITPFSFGVSRFVFSASNAGNYRLANFAPNYSDVPSSELLCDKIELIPKVVNSGTEFGEKRKPGFLAVYPNPFNPSVTLSVSRAPGNAPMVAVYDVRGKLIKVLPVSIVQPAAYGYEWDGRTAIGSPVASGIYFFTVKMGDKIYRTRATLMK